MQGKWQTDKRIGKRRYIHPVKKGWRTKKGNTKRWRPLRKREHRCMICQGRIPRGRHDTCSGKCSLEKLRRVKLHSARINSRQLQREKRRMVILPTWLGQVREKHDRFDARGA